MHSRDARGVLGNMLWLGLLQVAGYVFPLLTVPYMAHVVGVTRFGEIAFAAAVMVYMQTFVDYGFIFSAVRDIARRRDDVEAVSEIYSRVMWARFALTGAALVVLTVLILAVPYFRQMTVVLYASFLMVIGQAMFPDWMFQALERMRYITLFNVVVKLLFTLSVFLFITKPDDYVLQPVLTAAGYVLSGLGAMWVIHRWGIRMRRPEAGAVWRGIKGNWDLFLNQLAPNLYNSLSILLLGFFHGSAANGVYDAGNRFGTAGASFFAILSRAFFPFLSRRGDQHRRFVAISLVSALVVGGGLAAAAPWIIDTFFPAAFDGSVTVLQILAGSLVFLALVNAYGTNYLILEGRERELRRITVWSSVLAMCVAVPAVYYLSAIGVAVAVAFGRGALAVGSMAQVWHMRRAVAKG